jgi:hypothetical protein
MGQLDSTVWHLQIADVANQSKSEACQGGHLRRHFMLFVLAQNTFVQT